MTTDTKPRDAGRETELRIVGLAGSLRQGSYNRALLRAAQELAPDGLTLEIHTLEEISLYNADVEAEGVPPPVTALRSAIEAADGVLIATPEYNSGIPGVLKNTIDWLSRPPRPQTFDGVPVAVMGATPGLFGTRSAQLQLRQILGHLAALVMPQPQVLLMGAKDRFDADLRLTDEDARRRVERLLTAFAAWIRRLGKP